MSGTVAIWGAGGVVGTELNQLLSNHPRVQGVEQIGRDFPDSVDHIETAFLALPHSESAKVAAQLVKLGTRVIDLSGDLRFPDAKQYERWYGVRHAAPELLPVPYGMPEWDTGRLVNAQVVSMPGCYPTATLLGIRPLIQSGLIAYQTPLSVVAISGTSGRGRDGVKEIHKENVVQYNVGHRHRHVGEIEQFTYGHEINFVPSTVDVYRGMLATTVGRLSTKGISTGYAHGALVAAYQESPFVQILEEGEIPTLRTGPDTDMCYIGVVADNECVTVISAIDNLRKGAASQAVQVFNLMNGYDETAGLAPNEPARNTTSCR